CMSYILVYVDDMLVSAKDPAVLKQIKSQLKQHLEVKDMGEIGTFLGVDFKSAADGTCLTMSQERYIEELAERFNLNDAKPQSSLPPIDTIEFTEEDKVNEEIGRASRRERG